jgi:glycosyltransferase involved in cell wall biosynthesis
MRNSSPDRRFNRPASRGKLKVSRSSFYSAEAAVLQLVLDLDAPEPGRCALDLARVLRASGWRALMASAGGTLQRELAAAGATHLPLPLDASGRFARWRNVGRLSRIVREHRVALIHGHAQGASSIGAEVARATALPLVVTAYDVEVPGSAAARRDVKTMLAADRVITASEFVADRLVADHGVPPERVRVVPLWFDPAEFDPERVRGHRVLALAERWGVAPGLKVILAPPPHPEDRGHLLLLKALAVLPRTDCVAVLAGAVAESSDYGDRLVTAIRKAGLGERVRFAGPIADLAAALSLADIVVLPATRPVASGVLAAMAQAMGKPVIVSNQGALAECVLPAATGWLVPSDDPVELARALELALALDEGSRLRLAMRARAFVCGEFSLEAMCARTLAVYRELIGARASCGTQHRLPLA